ncbi:hypothetical protein [Cyanobium sp. WAJ14-Wanaka]|uniref:hypothetical protein n=1 Tax=Cyanobium sp. WAJ14-Wanaka TaxID=2823725 RepID=UPI0020CC6CA0|nr:hypothetical protein [Cyanobium sp. WAJ14-Wanaka]MCP9774074.1 hypothetical protein [Cyanobium sp. WAJ14-Wanaka]
MASEHPDAPKQLGLRLPGETMELISAIQEHRKQSSQATTIAAIVEDAIGAYYDQLVDEGQISDK